MFEVMSHGQGDSDGLSENGQGLVPSILQGGSKHSPKLHPGQS